MLSARSPLDRWLPAAGIVAVVLGMAGGALFGDGNRVGLSDAELTAWYAERGHRVTVAVAYFAVVVSVLAFLAFAAGLIGRLHTDGGGRVHASWLALAAGAASAVLVGVAATAGFMAATQRSKWGDVAAFDADTARTTNFLGEVLFETALAFASLLVAATSLVARRSACFRRGSSGAASSSHAHSSSASRPSFPCSGCSRGSSP